MRTYTLLVLISLQLLGSFLSLVDAKSLREVDGTVLLAEQQDPSTDVEAAITTTTKRSLQSSTSCLPQPTRVRQDVVVVELLVEHSSCLQDLYLSQSYDLLVTNLIGTYNNMTKKSYCDPLCAKDNFSTN